MWGLWTPCCRRSQFAYQEPQRKTPRGVGIVAKTLPVCLLITTWATNVVKKAIKNGAQGKGLGTGQGTGGQSVGRKCSP